MKLSLLSALLIAGLFAALPAFALDLHQARQQGILGEKADGFVAVLKKSSEADAVAATVNAKRRAEYQKISRENSQPVDVVGKLAAQQIVQGLEPGALYDTGNGVWNAR